MRAWSLIRTQPHYRHDAFLSGLRAAGYDVQTGAPRFPVRPGELMVIWNRYGDKELLADRFEAEGGTVIVAENGYLSCGGGTPKFDAASVQPGHYYALAIHGHNGSGTWYAENDPARFQRLCVDLKPLRVPRPDQHILVCPNRTFGMRGFIMPNDFVSRVQETLAHTGRRIVVRQHPGNDKPARPLEADLENAYCCVIWSSSAGVHALVAGVPVICMAPWWICKEASSPTWEHMQHMLVQDWERRRLAAFRRLAFAQWTVEEIASGEAFRYLLRAAEQAEVAAGA